jgi:hypothetical protein
MTSRASRRAVASVIDAAPTRSWFSHGCSAKPDLADARDVVTRRHSDPQRVQQRVRPLRLQTPCEKTKREKLKN